MAILYTLLTRVISNKFDEKKQRKCLTSLTVCFLINGYPEISFRTQMNVVFGKKLGTIQFLLTLK